MSCGKEETSHLNYVGSNSVVRGKRKERKERKEKEEEEKMSEKLHLLSKIHGDRTFGFHRSKRQSSST